MAGNESISLSEFESDARGWIERLQHQPPVVLTEDGRGRAVIQSFDEYQRAQFELFLLTRLNKALAADKAGELIPQDEVFDQARARLERRIAEREQ